MKPQRKVNILVTVETAVIFAGATAVSIIFIDGALALLPISAAALLTLFLGLYIKKRVLGLTWREAYGPWDFAEQEGGKNDDGRRT